ncbi:MAG: winged helix-turn-helix transcriptional regulator [Archangium sp.]
MALLPMMQGTSVLVVSDGSANDELSGTGVHVTVQNDVTSAARELQTTEVHLALLRGPLRGWSTSESVRALRKLAPIPVLVVNDEGESARLELFEAGADEVVTSACSSKELAVRVAALVRRSGRISSRRLIERGALKLDAGAQSAAWSGTPLGLTGYEFSLLRVLAEDAGRAVSREELMERAKGSVDESFERSIDVHVCRLRAKLARFDGASRLLKTVRGVGYMLENPPDAVPQCA